MAAKDNEPPVVKIYDMENLALLKKVRRVEAPPFLQTRIQAKIRASAAERLPASWQWAGGLAFALLLFLNGIALRREKTAAQPPSGLMAESLEIQTSNQLYDE